MARFVPAAEFEDLVGSALGPSSWMVVDQDRIDAFADATDDHQFIHVDPDAAASGPFGTTIAHGFLTLSLASALLSEVAVFPDDQVMAVNYGLNKLRFLAPVPAGSRIRLRATITDITARSAGSYLVTHDVEIEIEGEPKPALVAQMLTLSVAPG